jgi:chaperone BCS1
MWEQITTFISQQVQNNDLFKGGLLLMVGGAAAALLRPWPARLWGFIKRQSMVVIDIPDKDQAFRWINLWLAEHNYSKKRARLLTVKTELHDKRFDKPTVIYSPAPGTHYLWYQKRLMVLTRERKDQPQTSGGAATFREFFTMRILGRGRGVVTSLIQDAYELANPDSVDRITIHRAKHYGEWVISTWAPKRPLESVILPDGTADKLIADVQTFLDSEQWYMDRGLPYRRGYLFYGPPGNGKTSIAMSLATHFDRDIGVLNLKSSQLSDDDLSDALANAPKNTFIFTRADCHDDNKPSRQIG